MTGGHTVAGVINWDYLALKVGIFIDSQKLSSIFHLSLNHFVHPAKKIKKGNCCQKSTFSRLTERPTSKFGVTLMGSQEASMPGVVAKKNHFSKNCLAFIRANPLSRYIHDECYGVALDADGNYLIIGG